MPNSALRNENSSRVEIKHSNNPNALLKKAENFQNSTCILIAGDMPDAYRDNSVLKSLARIRWLCVFDFDINSRSSGLLRHMESEAVIQTSTWMNDPVLSSTFTQWCLLRGSVDDQDSCVDCQDVKTWYGDTRSGIERHLDRLNDYLEVRPFTIVIMWPGQQQSYFIEKFFSLLDNKISDAARTVYVINENSPDDIFTSFTSRNSDFTLTCPMLTFCEAISKKVESRSIDGACDYTLVTNGEGKYCKIRHAIAARIDMDLNVLYLEDNQEIHECPVEEIVQKFLSGGLLDWSVYYAVDEEYFFDVKRDITDDTIRMIKTEYIEKCRTGKVDIFHAPGSGGSTFARRLLWELHKETVCAQLKPNKKLSLQNIVDNIGTLYTQTHMPIVLLVDGVNQSFVDLLLDKCRAEDSILVILNVHRYHAELDGTKGPKKCVRLPVYVSVNEAKKFYVRYQSHCKTNERRAELAQIVEDTKAGKKNPIYMFGLTTFMEDYRGVDALVREYLHFGDSSFLQPFQTILGYLSLVYKYGQVALPCQVFSQILDISPKKYLTEEHFPKEIRDLAIFEEVDGIRVVRICHQLVAVELLEQILTRKTKNEVRREDTRYLSDIGKKGLQTFCIDFVKFISKQTKCYQLKAGSVIIDILIKTFIQRDYHEVGTSETHGRKKLSLSRLLTDVNDTQDRLELMETIADHFPDNPSFRAHVGRMYSNYRPEDEKKAEDSFLRALELCKPVLKQNEFDDNYVLAKNEAKHIQHMYGMFCCRKIEKHTGKHLEPKKNVKNFEEIFFIVKPYEDEALRHFDACRQYAVVGTDELYAITGAIKTKMLVLQFIHAQKPLFDVVQDEFCHQSIIRYVFKSLPFTMELFSESFNYKEELEDMPYSDYRKEMKVFQIVYKDFPRHSKFHMLSEHSSDSIESRRIRINAIKISHDPMNIETIPDREVNEMLDALNQTIVDIDDHGTKLCKHTIDITFKDWINTIRKGSISPSYSLKVVLDRMRIWNETVNSISSRFYLFVILSILGIETKSLDFLVEASVLKEKIEKDSKAQTLLRPRSIKEWFGKSQKSIACLIPGRLIKRQQDTRTVVESHELQPLRGIISRDTKRKQSGRILLDLPSECKCTVSIFFVPVLTKEQLVGPAYAGQRVEFVLGFRYSGGYEAYNVRTLRDIKCQRCEASIEIRSDVKWERCKCGSKVRN